MQKLTRETGTALIWITHDLSVIAGLADRVSVMYAGRIVEQGTVEEVLAAPRHPYTRGLLDSVPSNSVRGARLQADSRHDAVAARPAARLRVSRALQPRAAGLRNVAGDARSSRPPGSRSDVTIHSRRARHARPSTAARR